MCRTTPRGPVGQSLSDGLLELLSAGMAIDEVLADSLDLARDDILAPLEFGASRRDAAAWSGCPLCEVPPTA